MCVLVRAPGCACSVTWLPGQECRRKPDHKNPTCREVCGRGICCGNLVGQLHEQGGRERALLLSQVLATSQQRQVCVHAPQPLLHVTFPAFAVHRALTETAEDTSRGTAAQTCRQGKPESGGGLLIGGRQSAFERRRLSGGSKRGGNPHIQFQLCWRRARILL